MLDYAIVFAVFALIASLLGFSGVAGLSVQIGWAFAVLAVIFLALTLITGRGRRRSFSLRRRRSISLP